MPSIVPHAFSIHEFRMQLATILNRVSLLGHRIVIRKRNEPIAALLPLPHLELFEAVLPLVGIDARMPDTQPPKHWCGVSDALPRHFGIYGSPELYARHAANPRAGLRMLIRLIEEHAMFREIPDGCVGEAFWEGDAVE